MTVSGNNFGNIPGSICARFSRVLVIIIFVATLVCAQGSAGGIAGIVTDTTGALIPGADIKAKTSNTNLMREVVAGEDGGYLIAALPPGNYDLIVSAPGFSANTIKGVKVSVSYTTRLDLELTPGEVSEVVEVKGSEEQTH